MYRCMVCETPAQPGCDCAKAGMQEEPVHKYDPWGWKPEQERLDIQSGLRVRVQHREEMTA